MVGLGLAALVGSAAALIITSAHPSSTSFGGVTSERRRGIVIMTSGWCAIVQFSNLLSGEGGQRSLVSSPEVWCH